VHDACANGQKIKCLIVIDEFTKVSLAIDVAGSIRSGRVVEIGCTAQTLSNWVHQHDRDLLLPFVVTLGNSRASFMRFSAREDSPAWCSGQEHAFDYFGGIPLTTARFLTLDIIIRDGSRSRWGSPPALRTPPTRASACGCAQSRRTSPPLLREVRRRFSLDVTLHLYACQFRAQPRNLHLLRAHRLAPGSDQPSLAIGLDPVVLRLFRNPQDLRRRRHALPGLDQPDRF
jgi:hypothetical protein